MNLFVKRISHENGDNQNSYLFMGPFFSEFFYSLPEIVYGGFSISLLLFFICLTRKRKFSVNIYLNVFVNVIEIDDLLGTFWWGAKLMVSTSNANNSEAKFKSYYLYF